MSQTCFNTIISDFAIELDSALKAFNELPCKTCTCLSCREACLGVSMAWWFLNHCLRHKQTDYVQVDVTVEEFANDVSLAFSMTHQTAELSAVHDLMRTQRCLRQLAKKYPELHILYSTFMMAYSFARQLPYVFAVLLSGNDDHIDDETTRTFSLTDYISRISWSTNQPLTA